MEDAFEKAMDEIVTNRGTYPIVEIWNAAIEAAANACIAVADEIEPPNRIVNYWKGRRYGAQQSAAVIRGLKK